MIGAPICSIPVGAARVTSWAYAIALMSIAVSGIADGARAINGVFAPAALSGNASFSVSFLASAFRALDFSGQKVENSFNFTGVIRNES